MKFVYVAAFLLVAVFSVYADDSSSEEVATKIEVDVDDIQVRGQAGIDSVRAALNKVAAEEASLLDKIGGIAANIGSWKVDIPQWKVSEDLSAPEVVKTSSDNSADSASSSSSSSSSDSSE